VPHVGKAALNEELLLFYPNALWLATKLRPWCWIAVVGRCAGIIRWARFLTVYSGRPRRSICGQCDRSVERNVGCVRLVGVIGVVCVVGVAGGDAV
jgi:hypothetical protein